MTNDKNKMKSSTEILGDMFREMGKAFVPPEIICVKKGHKWINVDTGDAENGPKFEGTCARCGKYVNQY